MLIILTTKWHMDTVSLWLSHFNLDTNNIVVYPYEALSGSMPAGNYLFSDLERISKQPKRFKQVIEFANCVRQSGYKVINDPARALMRYDLQKALKNEFKTYRKDEDLTQVTYPAFVRLEHGHKAVSELIDNEADLLKVVHQVDAPLICEFLDTADQNGLYHKYSAFFINGKVIPRHKIFSHHWIVKEPDHQDDNTLSQEETYCQSNPHEQEVKQIFEQAHIDYGRIDYTEFQGELKVWEINTNPNLNPTSTGDNPRRNALFAQSAELFNIELLNLADANGNSSPLTAPFYLRGAYEKLLNRVK